MDSLSTAYSFTTRDSVIDVEASIAPAPMPRAAVPSSQRILEGLDAYAAVYEPAGY